MANPQNVIADAFEKLKSSVSDEDAYNFASTELKDVWSAVKDIDSKQRKRQSAQNLRRIEPLLQGIGKYTKVIEVLCNGTPYMPYVWVRPRFRFSCIDEKLTAVGSDQVDARGLNLPIHLPQ